MSDGNVIHLTDELIKELKEKKIVSDQSSEIELAPVAGNEQLGVLTSQEIIIFTEITIIEEDLKDWSKELYARSAEAVASATRRSETPFDIARNLEDEKLFRNKEEAEQFQYELTKLSYLQGLFWYTLRDRLQTFATNLSIRSGFTVCKTGYKYKV